VGWPGDNINTELTYDFDVPASQLITLDDYKELDYIYLGKNPNTPYKVTSLIELNWGDISNGTFYWKEVETLDPVTVIAFDPENGKEWTPFFGPEIHEYALVTFSESIEGSSLAGITINGVAPQKVEIVSLAPTNLKIYDYFDWASDFAIIIPAAAINGLQANVVYTFTTPPEILEIAALLPDEDAADMALNAEVAVVFNKNILTNSLITPTVTITKTGGDNVGGVAYVPVNPVPPSHKLVITHDAFEYESEYTVTIPVDVVMGWNEPIIWKFSTLPAPPPIYTISASVLGSGKIEPEGDSIVNQGESITYSFTNALCWCELSKVLIDGVNDPEAVDTKTFTFTNVTANHTIVAIFENVGVTAVENFQTLQVYPNPTKGEFTITNYELVITNIEIFDVYGKKLLSHSAYRKPNTTLNISHLANGIYFLKIDTERGTITKKIIKNY
jgi:hypothetical protein